MLTASIAKSARNEVSNWDLKDDAFETWLSPSTWEVEAQLVANRSQRVEGSLQWVLDLEKFKRWRLGGHERVGNTPAATLWITGRPGVGKSTISAYLFDILKQQYPENAVLHFFCKSGTPHLNSAHDIVRTICYQLTQKQPFYRRYLQSMTALPNSGGSESLVLLFNRLIKEPLEKGMHGSDLFILLDGLDELENSTSPSTDQKYSGKTEIEVLLELLVQLPRAKILVTSRPSPELKRILDESGAAHDITRGDNATDIDRYVKFRMEKSSNLSRGFDQIEKDPVKFFGEKSNGIFLWVVVVLDILERASTAKAFLSALDELPPALNNLYDQIIKRAKISGNYKWIREVLNWTLIVPKPLSIEQMKTAIELSTGDQIFDMENLLRSECGSLVDLVPVLGAALGQSYEIHIGHETFQAYLSEISPTKDDGEGIFSAPRAHAIAAQACLRYLIGTPKKADDFYKYATTRWRWHLMKSIGSEQTDPPRNILVDFTTHTSRLCPSLAKDLLLTLYQFLTTDKIDSWLEWHFIDKYPFSLPAFEEIRNCCYDISYWYRINKEALSNLASSPLKDTEAYAFVHFMDGIEDQQTLLDPIWPRACHVFMWNSWNQWEQVFWGYRTLINLRIWTTQPELRVRELQMIKEQITCRRENRYHPFQLSVLDELARKEQASRAYLNAITAAGKYDDITGVCHANLAVACQLIRRNVRDSDESTQWFQESMEHLQEAIDEDPTGNPRYHETVGLLYEDLEKEELALEAFSRGISCDPQNVTCCREKYYTIKKEIITRGDTPDYDAAIALYEEGIREDSRNANRIYFHQMAEMYKKKGDLEGVRKTYKASMIFDPSWGSEWEAIANTYIDEENFKERREFDWRGYCDVFTTAAVQDPSNADSYWWKWINKAKDLSGQQAFSLAVDILEYGVMVTSQMQTESAVEARPRFEKHLGETYCAMCDWDSAILVLEDALKHTENRDDSIYCSLGRAYTSCGRYEEALAAFSNLVEGSPNWSSPHSWTAEVHYLTKQYQGALKEYKTAIRLCQAELEKEVFRNIKEKAYLSLRLGEMYRDLGCVYDRLSRADQARSCFTKALPYFEHSAEVEVSERGKENIGSFMHRSEGRVLMSLAWLYERIQPDDERVEITYQKAVEVFKTVVFEEDDFLEEAEGLEAEQALERVRRGEPWVLPTEEEDRALRERSRARKYRINYGVNLDSPRESMMRGRC